MDSEILAEEPETGILWWEAWTLDEEVGTQCKGDYVDWVGHLQERFVIRRQGGTFSV